MTCKNWNGTLPSFNSVEHFEKLIKFMNGKTKRKIIIIAKNFRVKYNFGIKNDNFQIIKEQAHSKI